MFKWLARSIWLFLAEETTYLLSYAAVSRIRCPFLRGKMSTGANSSFSGSADKASWSYFISVSNVHGLTFWAFCWPLELCKRILGQTVSIVWIVWGTILTLLGGTVILNRVIRTCCDKTVPICLTVYHAPENAFFWWQSCTSWDSVWHYLGLLATVQCKHATHVCLHCEKIW